MADTVASRTAADRRVLEAQTHGGLDDLHAELDKSPAHEAARENDLDALQALIDESGDCVHARDKYGFTPLHWAAERGHAAAVALLLRAGADPNSVETRLFRRTPLQLAACAPSLDAVCELLKRGANASASEYRGWRALHFAAYAGASDILRVLLDKGSSDARWTTRSGETPLHVAAAAGHAASVALLVARDKKLALATDPSGRTARELALVGGHTDVAALLPVASREATEEEGTGASAVLSSTKGATIGTAAASLALSERSDGTASDGAVSAPAS